MKKLALLAFMFLMLPLTSVNADITIDLDVETATSTLFSGPLTVSPCPESPGSATTTLNGFCALEQSGLAIEAIWSSFGAFVTSIGGSANDTDNFWLWFSDLEPGQTGIDAHILTEGEHILWTLDKMPLKLSVASASPTVGATTTATVTGFDPIAFQYAPIAGSTINGIASTTTPDGMVLIVPMSTDPLILFATKDGYLKSNFVTITPTAAPVPSDAATVVVRNGDAVGFSGLVLLPASTSPAVEITPTGTTTSVSVPAQSFLGILKTLDDANDSFSLSTLQYFPSFGAFFIKCVQIPPEDPACNNWRYQVNGTSPSVGADHYLLQNGDTAVLFFGWTKVPEISTSIVTVGEQFTASAVLYDPTTNAESPLTGVTLGVIQRNPSDTRHPTEIATSTVDGSGRAIFTLNATGTYEVGIKQTNYSPTVSLTVVEKPATTPPVNNPPPTGGGGGIVHVQLNVPNALAYLLSKQHANGSFDSPLLSDWAAIAFSASDPGSGKQLLRSYLLTATPALTSVTDYERHAMALQALGINPYSGTATNYIAHITSAFDGTQVGEISLDNDDIFALFPLLHAGYSTRDDIIQKTAAFIVSRQQANGAWDGSVDVTAAAIQALASVSSLPNVSTALSKAEGYLHAQQQGNGGWGNSFSTSWALQAVAALNQSASNWAPSGQNPNDYLASLQQSDGGVEPISSDVQTRVWATEYAIPAALGKSWHSLLSSFEKPVNTSGSGVVLGTSTSTVETTFASSTVSTDSPQAAFGAATSTPAVSTSTPFVLGVSTTTLPTGEITLITKTSVKKTPVAKKLTLLPKAPEAITTSAQVAAAASVPSESFLGRIWRAITSFFAWIF